MRTYTCIHTVHTMKTHTSEHRYMQILADSYAYTYALMRTYTCMHTYIHTVHTMMTHTSKHLRARHNLSSSLEYATRFAHTNTSYLCKWVMPFCILNMSTAQCQSATVCSHRIHESYMYMSRVTHVWMCHVSVVRQSQMVANQRDLCTNNRRHTFVYESHLNCRAYTHVRKIQKIWPENGRNSTRCLYKRVMLLTCISIMSLL